MKLNQSILSVRGGGGRHLTQESKANMRHSVIHLQLWANGSWGLLFPLKGSDCKLMSTEHYFS